MGEDLLELLDAVHHREQDAHRAVHRGAVDGAQLGLEHLGFCQADADGAEAHRGVDFRLLFELQREAVRLLLIGADGLLGQLARAKIQRADDGALAVHLANDLAVGVDLLLLAGQVRALEVQKFAAHQSQTVRVAADDLLDVQRLGDAGVDVNFPPVDGAVRFADQVAQAAQLLLLAALFLAQAAQGQLVRVDIKSARIGVHRRHMSLQLAVQLLAHAQQIGDVAVLGDDGRVGGLGTGAGDKGQHLFTGDLNHLAGYQLLRGQNGGLRRFKVFHLAVGQNGDQAVGDVQNVRCPLLQIGVR